MIFGIDKWENERPALVEDNEERGSRVWTYGGLRSAICEFANALKGRKLIFIMSRNVPEAVIGYLGALEQGSVSLLLADTLDRERLGALTETYRPGLIWRTAEEGEGEALFTLGRYGLYETGWEDCDMSEELALLLSTSGTTGSPKLIRISRRNLEANASSIAQYLELDEKARPVTTLPLNYTFGLSVINSHLSVGAAVLMTEHSIVQQPFWDFLSAGKGTSLAGVPYTYELLKRIRFMDRDDTATITQLVQAGGHLPVELQELFGKWAMEHGIRFYVMYGQTEATARMSYLPWQECLTKAGTIGIAIPGGRFELQDADGTVIHDTDTVGELVYYGANVTLGYATCREDLARPDERHGVLHTGDMASVDKDGYYTVRGRLSRFVKLYGVRVGLDDCENILKSMDTDADFACVGTDSKVTIYTNSQRRSEVGDILADRLRLRRNAFETVYIEQIPVTESGKKDYARLGASGAGN